MTATPSLDAKEVSLPVGVVVRRSPGVTRWAKEHWRPVAILPGAGPERWKLLREEGGTAEFHAATVTLTLHRKEVDGYRVAMSMTPPSAFVVLRAARDEQGFPVKVHVATASAYEAQAFTDAAEDIVEPVPMPAALLALVEEFCARHSDDTPFVKRHRDRHRTDLVEDGRGDPRIRQAGDVYRSPAAQKPGAGDE